MPRLPRERVRILDIVPIIIPPSQYGRRPHGADAARDLAAARRALGIDKHTFGNYPRHVCYQFQHTCQTCVWWQRHRELIARQIAMNDEDALDTKDGWC